MLRISVARSWRLSYWKGGVSDVSYRVLIECFHTQHVVFEALKAIVPVLPRDPCGKERRIHPSSVVVGQCDHRSAKSGGSVHKP
jgi:hypothetical protein